MNREDYQVIPVSYEDTKPFILNIHYAKRMPSISYAYGLLDKEELVGVVTYGMPASPWLCKGLCGEDNKKLVIELNRLVLKYNRKNEASFLVSASLKMLPKPRVVVSYADTAQGHTGYIYQACNFLFTGTTKPRTDMAAVGGKHPRHHAGDRTNRIARSSKHRYVYFLGNKTEVSTLKKALRYTIQPYPKLVEETAL
jgi:hypothetical protein